MHQKQQDGYTDFGFKQVTEEQKTSLVEGVFSSVANKYDLMNDLMSFFAHRLWKEIFIKYISLKPNMKIIDVAGGTGDIAIKIIKNSRKNHLNCCVTVYDLTKSMINIGRKRALDMGIVNEIQWLCGDAANMSNIDSNQYDAYTISFGLRNVTLKQKALQEAYRVIKPGGKFICMEFSKVKNPILNRIYKSYSFNIIPKIGELILKDKESYEYLVESIENFPNQEQLSEILKQTGFKHVKYKNLFGGIVAIHIGVK